jgi:23S rRNA pseudouridine1911/1915/1917 synthase
MKLSAGIIFEDNQLLVVNKPSGVTVIPERFAKEKGSLQAMLEKDHGKLFVVHRIDRGTSGVICFAKNEAAHKNLSHQFEHRLVKKVYKALVQGRMEANNGIITAHITENPARPGTMITAKKGKEALTIYEVEEAFKSCSLLKVEIKTGRTHQIRVHLAHIGHPLLVDDIYGNAPAFYFSSIKRNYKASGEEERPTISRLTLHASQLTINHPATNEEVTFTAPLAHDLEIVLKLLRKYGQ